jgi:hypothetical protein
LRRDPGDELAQRDHVRVAQPYTVAKSYGSTRVEDLRQCSLGLLDRLPRRLVRPPPNFGAPDTGKYFSNENVGAPLEMSSHGVWETAEVQSNPTGSCPPSYVSRYVVRQSPTTVDGVATTRYVINQTPSGAEAAYLIGVWVTHGGSCYSIQFVSLTPSARDANADVADQAIASFKFGA